MGKFAALYDLPGGEQLLVMVIEGKEGEGPVVQYVTEINGLMVTAEIILCEGEALVNGQPDHLKRMAAKEEARHVIQGLSQETVKDLRRKFVRDITGKEEEVFTKEDMQHVN
jgi:ABC-type microcin C transport system permease subunit YejB